MIEKYYFLEEINAVAGTNLKNLLPTSLKKA